NFRIVAANANGTNYGAAQEFTMPYPAAATAMSFDGVNDFVLIGTDVRTKVTNALTLEAWIHPTGPGSGTEGSGVIINREGEYMLARYGDGTLRFAIDNTSPNWFFINTGVIAPANRWLHVAFTYDKDAITN